MQKKEKGTRLVRTDFTSIGLPASRNQQLFARGNVLINGDERERVRECAWVCVGLEEGVVLCLDRQQKQLMQE